MEDDKRAIVVGLSAGLGGFAGLLIIGCICWQICCGSWGEKKNVKPTIGTIPVKHQQQMTTATKINNNILTETPMRTMNKNSDLKPSTSSDLANKVKPIRR